MMKHLQFSIFLSSLAFVLAKSKFYEGFGEKEGKGIWEITKDAKLTLMDSEIIDDTKFSSNSSYIVLLTEYHLPTSSENQAEIEIKGFNVHYIYYVVPEKRSELKRNMRKVLSKSVAQLFQYVRERSIKDVTITRLTQDRKSKEYLMFFSHVFGNRKQDTKESSTEASKELSEEKKLIFRDTIYSAEIYKLTEEQRILQEDPTDGRTFNFFDGYVIDTGTKLIGIRTKNENLQNYTANFINFIKSHRSENTKIQIRDAIEDLFVIPNDDLNRIRFNGNKEPEEHYILIGWKWYFPTQITNTIKLKRGLVTSDIKDNREYMLANINCAELILYIRPNIKVSKLQFLLDQGESKISAIEGVDYKLSIHQPHKPNMSFLIAFKDIVPYLLNNEHSDKLDKFIKKDSFEKN